MRPACGPDPLRQTRRRDLPGICTNNLAIFRSAISQHDGGSARSAAAVLSCPDGPVDRGGDPMHLGFIGTGTMGAPMANCLIDAGHDLTVYDLRPEVTAALGA